MQGSARHTIGNVAIPLPHPEPLRKPADPQRKRRLTGARKQSRGLVRLHPVRLAFTLVVVLGLLSFIGVRQVAITGLGYEIDRMKGQLEALHMEQAALEGRMAQLAAPQRIEQAALALGMVESGQMRIARVERLQAQPQVARVERQPVVVALPVNAGNEGEPTYAQRATALVDRLSEWLFALVSGQHVLAESSR